MQVHVKHMSKTFDVPLSQEDSILQLKQKIETKIQVDPARMQLLCNGKLLDVDDTTSIKQAKIPNGSKMLVTTKPEDAMKPTDSVIHVLDKLEAKADQIETNLSKIVRKRKDLVQEDLPLFHGDKSSDLKKMKFESKKIGEELMQLFETLDNIECSDSDQRTRRKQVATKINGILDKSDKLSTKLDRDLRE